MTASGYTFAHYKILGDQGADWSHASTYLANLNKSRLEAGDPLSDTTTKESKFRDALTAVRGIHELSETDRLLAEDLAESDGVDISYFPGGDKYEASVVSSTNPLGLAGDMWAMVSEDALVSALVRLTSDNELEVKWPDGFDWESLDDPSVLSDYDYVGVTADAVPLFQNYDRDNTLGVISSYPLSDTGPFPTQAQLEVPMSKEIPEPRADDDEYWENTGETPAVRKVVPAVTASVRLDSEDDLIAAIAAATNDPDLRWYVERRVAALGLEASLPWLEV